MSEKQSIDCLTLWDSIADPSTHEGVHYLWNGYDENGTIHSLLNYAEIHGETLRSKYLAWIYELGESRFNDKRLIDLLAFKDGLSYWWMTLLVEKSLYKSPITDAIRLFALEDILVQQESDRLRLVSSNRHLHDAVSGLCKNLGIDYEWERTPAKWCRSGGIRGIYSALPHPMQALLSLVRYVWGRWPLRQSEKMGWFDGDRSLFICSYFDNVDPKAAEHGCFHSYYWGGIHSLLNRIGCKNNWLQLFVPCASVISPKAAMKWTEHFNRNQQKQEFHSFLDTYLCWRILLRVIKRWFWLNIIAWKLRKIKQSFRPPGSHLSLWPVMQEDWQASMRGSVAINNLLQIELFDAALRNIPHQDKGLYLCENQGWERALIHAWRKHGHGRLIAVAHSTVRFWDLRYYTDSRTIHMEGENAMPQPDFIALNGKAAMNSFLSVDYPQEMIVECEALRYVYLNEFKIIRMSKYEGEKQRKVLVLGDVMPSTTTKLLKLLEESISHNPDMMTYVVKPHPNCPVRPEDFPSLRLKIVTESLDEILQDYDVAYTSNSTSAAVDVYLAGLPVVVMLDATELNFSPLRGQAGVCFVSTLEELAEALLSQSCDTVNKPDSNEYFSLDPKLPKWSNLLAS